MSKITHAYGSAPHERLTTDNTPAELVTEEMIAAAALAYRQTHRVEEVTGVFPTHEDCTAAALRAVAPMIAARAMDDDKVRDRVVVIAQRLVAAEREACARRVEDWGDTPLLKQIAADIRARGETT